MPKAKATQVVTHRIEFQEKERELLEAYAYSSMVAKLVPSMLAAAGIGLAGYGLYYFFKEVYDIKGDIEDAWRNVKDAVNPMKPETSIIGDMLSPEVSNPAFDKEQNPEIKDFNPNKGCDWWDVACQMEGSMLDPDSWTWSMPFQ